MNALRRLACVIFGHIEAYPLDCPYWSQPRGVPQANFCRRCLESQPDHTKPRSDAGLPADGETT